NPIACAAARASLALVASSADRRAGIERAHRSAATTFAAHPQVRNVRVLGTVMAFEIGTDDGYLNQIGLDLRSFALDRGVLLRPLGNTVYFLPPYCSTDADLARAYAVVVDFLANR